MERLPGTHVELEDEMTLIEMAHKVYGEHCFWTEESLLKLKQLEIMIRSDEREACAIAVQGHGTWAYTEAIAAAIRARGQA